MSAYLLYRNILGKGIGVDINLFVAVTIRMKNAGATFMGFMIQAVRAGSDDTSGIGSFQAIPSGTKLICREVTMWLSLTWKWLRFCDPLNTK